MRVESVRVVQATGGLLLHTHRLPSGVLRKGTPLTLGGCRQLEAAGIEEVMVAHLEPGEVPEDAAANRVARALGGAGTTLRPAHTGRCNLHAARAGLLHFAADRLDAVNLCDWRVTVATQPALARVQAGDLLATVKILPFAVDEAVLRRAETRAAEPEAVLTVRGFVPLRVGLVVTHLAGTPKSRNTRAIEAQRTRIAALGSELCWVETCAHRTEVVAAALRQLLTRGADLVLVLGASSVMGDQDVLPMALRAIGGTVEHIGMPVDPGNLLLLGRADGRPVLGVPGCARSVRRTGFDWVLERIAAGLPVSARDLMTLGAGGLLTAPSSARKAPSAEPPARTEAVGAVVLAAGASRRMRDGSNKLLEPVEGLPMVRRAVAAAADAGLAPILVVTGHDAAGVRSALAGAPVRFVHNPNHEQGMGSSLAAGAAALASVDAAVVLLGDMPDIDAPLLDRLIRTWREHPGAVVAPSHGGVRGNPVLFDGAHLPALRGCSGDRGARALLEQSDLDLVLVPVASAAVLADIDTPEDLAARLAGVRP